jgi:hypothetical protein
MKYKILSVSPHVFLEICKNGCAGVEVIKNAIPQDARYVRAYIENLNGWGYVNLVLESESFSELKEGDVIPMLLHPIFEKKK